MQCCLCDDLLFWQNWLVTDGWTYIQTEDTASHSKLLVLFLFEWVIQITINGYFWEMWLYNLLTCWYYAGGGFVTSVLSRVSLIRSLVFLLSISVRTSSFQWVGQRLTGCCKFICTKAVTFSLVIKMWFCLLASAAITELLYKPWL